MYICTIAWNISALIHYYTDAKLYFVQPICIAYILNIYKSTVFQFKVQQIENQTKTKRKKYNCNAFVKNHKLLMCVIFFAKRICVRIALKDNEWNGNNLTRIMN